MTAVAKVANEAGAWTLAADFAPKPPMFVGSWGHDLPIQEQEYLIQGWFPKCAYSAILSRYGGGKTFLLVEAAYCGALGLPFLGQPILDPFGSVICVGEKKARFGKRPRAWLRHRGLEGKLVPVLNVEGVPSLLDPDAVDAFIAYLKETARPALEAEGVPLEAVWLDTLARCMGGASVSDQESANRAVDAIEKIVAEARVAVIPAAHVTKASSASDATMKGAGEWEDAAEAIIRIEREGTADIRKVTNTKQSDGPEAVALGFRLERIVLGHTSRGREISSCVIAPEEAPETAKGGRPPVKAEDDARMILTAYGRAYDERRAPIRALGAAPGVQGVELDRVRTWAFKRLQFGGLEPIREADMSEGDHAKALKTWRGSRNQAFGRALDRLKASGRLRVEDLWAWEPGSKTERGQ